MRQTRCFQCSQNQVPRAGIQSEWMSKRTILSPIDSHFASIMYCPMLCSQTSTKTNQHVALQGQKMQIQFVQRIASAMRDQDGRNPGWTWKSRISPYRKLELPIQLAQMIALAKGSQCVQSHRLKLANHSIRYQTQTEESLHMHSFSAIWKILNVQNSS